MIAPIETPEAMAARLIRVDPDGPWSARDTALFIIRADRKAIAEALEAEADRSSGSGKIARKAALRAFAAKLREGT